jgi:hypothetical protein
VAEIGEERVDEATESVGLGDETLTDELEDV